MNLLDTTIEEYEDSQNQLSEELKCILQKKVQEVKRKMVSEKSWIAISPPNNQSIFKSRKYESMPALKDELLNEEGYNSEKVDILVLLKLKQDEIIFNSVDV